MAPPQAIQTPLQSPSKKQDSAALASLATSIWQVHRAQSFGISTRKCQMWRKAGFAWACKHFVKFAGGQAVLSAAPPSGQIPVGPSDGIEALREKEIAALAGLEYEAGTNSATLAEALTFIEEVIDQVTNAFAANGAIMMELAVEDHSEQSAPRDIFLATLAAGSVPILVFSVLRYRASKEKGISYQQLLG